MPGEVWVFFPEGSRGEVSELRKHLKRECQPRGWAVQERPTRVVRTRAAELQLVRGPDAVELYRRMHRARLAVVGIGTAQICLVPAKQRSPEGSLRSLRRFCRYKAFFVRLDVGEVNPVQWFTPFSRWLDETHCEGDYDPRCLPLHVFTCDDMPLDSAPERAAFDGRYGAATSRLDADRRRWRLDPTAYHGSETLGVAGHVLPQGFHWDVRPERGGGATLHTPVETWSVRTYVNVYPDAGVRGRAPFAERAS